MINMINKTLQKEYGKINRKHKKLLLKEKRNFEKIIKKNVLPVLVKKVKNQETVKSVHSFKELFGSDDLSITNFFIEKYLINNKLCLYIDRDKKLCTIYWLKECPDFNPIHYK